MSVAALNDIIKLIEDTDIKAERKGTANWFTTGYRISKTIFKREVLEQVKAATGIRVEVPKEVHALIDTYWDKAKDFILKDIKAREKKDEGLKVIPQGDDGFLIVFSGERDNYSAMEYVMTSVKKGSLRFAVFNPFMEELVLLLRELKLGELKNKSGTVKTGFGDNFNLGHTAATTNAELVLADRFNKGMYKTVRGMDLSGTTDPNPLKQAAARGFIKNQTLAQMRSDMNMVLRNSSFAFKDDPNKSRIVSLFSRLTQSPQTETSKMIVIEMESVRGNLAGKEDETAVKAKMLKVLEDAVRRKSALEWANQEASDSVMTVVAKTLAQTANAKGARITDKSLLRAVQKSSNRASKSYKVKRKQVKRGREAAFNMNLNAKDIQSQTGIAATPSYLSLMTLLNESLPAQVRSNMGSPRLNNQTGRLSESARVTNIIQTPQGFPSIEYTYQRDPYDVFDKSRGKSPWNTPGRDPSALIGMSVRQIAQKLGMTRFYTRRAG